MAEETLKVIITADNKSAIEGLKQVSTATQSFVTAQGKLVVGSNQAAQALTNVGRVAQDLPFGFMGIQNNLNPLLESFQRLKAETGSNVGALKALGSSLIGAGGIGLALSVASSAFLLFGDRLFDSGKKAQEAKKAIDDATAGIAKDAAQVAVLTEHYRNSNLSLGQRQSIIKELNNISPEYFAGLKAETTSFQDLTKASNNYTDSLTNQIKAKILGIQLEKVLTDKLKAQEEQQKAVNLQQDFNIRNKTGRTDAGGSPALAKQIKDYEKLETLLIGQIALLGKVKDITKTEKEVTSTPADISRQAKFTPRPEQDLISALDANRLLIKAQNDSLDKLKAEQAKNTVAKSLMAGGLNGPKVPEKSQALAAYDQQQAVNQQMLLGIEQSRISALDEMNKKYFAQKQLADGIATSFVNMFAEIAAAPDPFAQFGESLKRLLIDTTKMIAQMFIMQAILTAINPAAGAAKGAGKFLGAIIGGVRPFATGGIVSAPTMGLVGEAGPEAILPLDRFQAMQDRAFGMGSMLGAASGGGGSQGGEFTLRGNDLVLALQRSNYSLNLRR